jgi:hypothetical protein
VYIPANPAVGAFGDDVPPDQLGQNGLAGKYDAASDTSAETCEASPDIGRVALPPTLQTPDGNVYQISTNGQPGSAECPVGGSGGRQSPLVLDVDDTPLALTPPTEGVRFDILGTGTQSEISWLARPSSAMFLVYDKAHHIDLALTHAQAASIGIESLFGNNTVGPDGQRAPNGFEALKKLARPGDLRGTEPVIDARNPVFSELALWADENRNAVVEPGELRSLASQNVEALGLGYAAVHELIGPFGDGTEQRASFYRTNGTRGVTSDVWFMPRLAP